MLQHSPFFARHERIIEGTSQKLLRKFVAWADSDDFQPYVEKERIAWADQFAALARKRLRALEKKS